MVPKKPCTCGKCSSCKTTPKNPNMKRRQDLQERKRKGKLVSKAKKNV